MTNDEAVEVLKNIVRGINQGHHELSDIDKQALTLAISALQQRGTGKNWDKWLIARELRGR